MQGISKGLGSLFFCQEVPNLTASSSARVLLHKPAIRTVLTHFGDDFHQGGSLCILGVCIQVRLQLGRHNLFVFQVSFVSSGLLASSNNHIIVAWCKVTCKWCHDVKTTGDLSFDIASIISSGSQDLVAVLDLQRAVW